MSLYFKWKLLWFLLEESMLELFVKPNKKIVIESTHFKEQWKFNSSIVFFPVSFHSGSNCLFSVKNCYYEGKGYLSKQLISLLSSQWAPFTK